MRLVPPQLLDAAVRIIAFLVIAARPAAEGRVTGLLTSSRHIAHLGVTFFYALHRCIGSFVGQTIMGSFWGLEVVVLLV